MGPFRLSDSGDHRGKLRGEMSAGPPGEAGHEGGLHNVQRDNPPFVSSLFRRVRRNLPLPIARLPAATALHLRNPREISQIGGMAGQSAIAVGPGVVGLSLENASGCIARIPRTAAARNLARSRGP